MFFSESFHMNVKDLFIYYNENIINFKNIINNSINLLNNNFLENKNLKNIIYYNIKILDDILYGVNNIDKILIYFNHQIIIYENEIKNCIKFLNSCKCVYNYNVDIIYLNSLLLNNLKQLFEIHKSIENIIFIINNIYIRLKNIYKNYNINNLENIIDVIYNKINKFNCNYIYIYKKLLNKQNEINKYVKFIYNLPSTFNI